MAGAVLSTFLEASAVGTDEESLRRLLLCNQKLEFSGFGEGAPASFLATTLGGATALLSDRRNRRRNPGATAE